MIGVYSILLGASIVVGALFLLRREFKQAYFIGPKTESNLSDVDTQASVLESIDKVEQGFMEMSEAFYDISGDLEGKYSVHEKELSLLENRILALEKTVKEQEIHIKKLEKQMEKGPSLKKKPEKIAEPTETIDKKESLEIKEDAFDLESRIEYRGNPQNESKEVNEPEATDTKGQIIALRSKGYSLKQIAKELNIGLGEIQLILNMKRS